MSLLTVDRVAVRYGRGRRALTAVDDCRWPSRPARRRDRGRIRVAGKSTLARAIVQLVPPRPAGSRWTAGT